MRTNVKSSEAVSPVVGVMLMLVVTIIIAAVVSAFAGGLVSAPKNTYQVTLKGTYSQANGLTITNAGGDVIPLSRVNFMTTPSDDMGPSAAKFAWVINQTIIDNPANNNLPIYNAQWGNYTTTEFRPGDTFIVTFANCEDYNSSSLSQTAANFPNPGVNYNAQTWWPQGSGKQNYFTTYDFGNPANLGEYFYLDMVDQTGAIISRAKVVIQP
jgi:hypothetical protein